MNLTLFDQFRLALVALTVTESLVLLSLRPQGVSLRETATSTFLFVGRPFAKQSIKLVLGSLFRTIIPLAIVMNLFEGVWPYRIATVPQDQWWAYPVLFLFADLAYYWEHRLKHTLRWFWPNHAVHHSSEKFNLAAGFRLGWTATLFTNITLTVPLVLLGFSPFAVTTVLAIQQVYQYIVHIEWIPKLGPLEYVMATPSNHRVHHATNDKYIDRNFAGVFIFWDRLFGTFVEEDLNERCRYGLLVQLRGQDPVRVLFFAWVDLFRDLRTCRDVKSGLICLFGTVSAWNSIRADRANEANQSISEVPGPSIERKSS